MKKTQQPTGSRFWVIVVLLVLLVVFAWLLYNRSKNIESFKDNFQYVYADTNLGKVDSCISILYMAENDTRLYLITKDTAYLNRFSNQIASVKQITSHLDLILQEHHKKDNLSKLIDEKYEVSKRVLNLTFYTDSLLQLSKEIQLHNDLAKKKLEQTLNRVKSIHLKPVVIVDTIVEKSNSKEVVLPNTKKKQGFFKRIADAIANKDHNEAAAPVEAKNQITNKRIVRKKILLDTTIEAKSYNDQQISAINHYYLKYINTKYKLDQEETRVLQLNTQIFNEFKLALLELRKIFESEQSRQAVQFKDNLKLSIDQYGLNATGLILIIALLAFIVVINLRKLYRDERELRLYSHQVHEYANHNKEFLANMSHELRTPLNSIIGFSEQLEKNVLDAQSSEYVSAIHTSSTMLLGIVNDILDFSRLELDKVVLIDQTFFIQQLITDLVSTVEIQADKKELLLEMEILNIDEKTCLRGDAFRIKQIILNLLSNAIKYTQKGKVHLKADLEHVDAKQVWLHVTVADTGIGIEDKYLELIFDKFAQISSSEFTEWQTGTGLGLAITKRIITLFGGKIDVKSKINQGSVFSVSLPLKTAEIESFESKSLQVSFHKEDFKNIKVLLVDDNMMNIKLAGVLLKKWGIAFDVAYDGKAAFDLFLNHQYNLVLTDVQMPIMNGVELTKAIRNCSDGQRAKTPIVGITANVLKNDIMDYLQAGMNDILLKPYSEEEYLSKVLLGK